MRKKNRYDKLINHPGRNKSFNTFIINVLRPPLLQKESLPRTSGGKVIFTY